MYFQRQGKFSLSCGLHSLNNLVGSKMFTHQILVEICQRLAPDATINPHKHCLFGGQYDANVLLLALSDREFQTKWHDNRNLINLKKYQSSYQMVGFLVNISTPKNCLHKIFRIQPRHWLAVRKYVGQRENWYFLLDSIQRFPNETIRYDDKGIQKYLNQIIISKKSEIIIVYKKQLPIRIRTHSTQDSNQDV